LSIWLVSAEKLGYSQVLELIENKDITMASYLVANYTVTNAEGYGAYVTAVGPIIGSHGGKILVAGPGSTPVEGNPGSTTVILEFPTREALQGWYDSPEYREIIALRTDNSEGVMVFADEFVTPT
jgi:uncharacterized protein (DUF1330 family)